MALTDIYRKIFGYDHLQDGTVIDLAEHGRAGADRDGQGFKFTRGVDEKTIVDSVSAAVTYVGTALPGVATSASEWQIKKITVAGTITSIEYPGGVEYIYVWDDRATYTYF